jgi:hypothetical protein
MTGPFETICVCGRTTLRPWPPPDQPILCDRCAEKVPYLGIVKLTHIGMNLRNFVR